MNNLIKNILMTPFNILYKVSPKMELELLFYLRKGYRLNLKNPRTYNEKLQWIKLYDKNPLMEKCCDKYHVRKYLKELHCEELLVKLIWEGYNPEDIPFDELPEKCVIKATHGSTFNIICKDVKKVVKQDVIKTCKRWLKEKFLPCYGEWFYGRMKPRIIIEEYLENLDGSSLNDYKVYCFNGEPRYIKVDIDRFSNHKCNIYSVNWKKIENVRIGFNNACVEVSKPECLEELLQYARLLSKQFLHARVDFYIVDGKIYFGEITFTSGAGFSNIQPYEFDVEMGNCLSLKKIEYEKNK